MHIDSYKNHNAFTRSLRYSRLRVRPLASITPYRYYFLTSVPKLQNSSIQKTIRLSSSEIPSFTIPP